MTDVLEKYKRVLLKDGFYKILAGGFLASMGNIMTNVALPWFLLTTSGSTSVTGFILFLSSIGGIIATPFVGLVMDRYPTKKVLAAQTLLLAAIVLAVVGLYALGFLSLHILAAAFFFRGLLITVYDISIALVLSKLFDEDDDLQRANVLRTVFYYSQAIASPLLSGFIISRFGAPFALLANGGLLLAFMFFLRAFKKDLPGSIRDGAANVWRNLAGGFSYVFKSRLLWGVLLVMATLNFTTESFSLIIPNLVKNELKRDAMLLGWFFSALYAGSFAGALMYEFYRHKKKLGLTLLLCNAGICLSLLFMAVFHRFVPILIASAFVQGILVGPLDIASVTLRQRLVSCEQRGRVFSFTMIINRSAASLGNAVSGLLLLSFGTGSILLAFGLLLAAATYGAFRIKEFRDAALGK
jgi:MFS family permease